MKSILGFGRSGDSTDAAAPDAERSTVEMPMRSLVSVRFPGVDRTYTYYNDMFDLHEGDMVFVTGKLAGTRGVVESVNYRFKISLADYQRVIARPEIKMNGTYAPVLDKMVSTDADAVSPDTFRSWVIPPAEDDGEEPEFVLGEGYTIDLEHITEYDEVEEAVLKRAIDYCSGGRVCYLSLRDGTGTAFVEGTKWYEVNFSYRNGVVSEMYCECPYPGLCKHSIAVLITLREIMKRTGERDFTAITAGFFMQMLTAGRQRIALLPAEDEHAA